MSDTFYHDILRRALTGAADLDSDTIKCALFTHVYVPDPDHTVLSDCGDNQLATGGGYTSGGAVVTLTVTDIDASNKVSVTSTNPTWMASGAGIGPFQYMVYFDSTSSDALILCHDCGADITITAGNPLTATIDPGGLFTIGQ